MSVPADAAALIRETVKVPMTDAEVAEVYETVSLLVEGWGDSNKTELVRAIKNAGDMMYGG